MRAHAWEQEYGSGTTAREFGVNEHGASQLMMDIAAADLMFIGRKIQKLQQFGL